MIHLNPQKNFFLVFGSSGMIMVYPEARTMIKVCHLFNRGVFKVFIQTDGRWDIFLCSSYEKENFSNGILLQIKPEMKEIFKSLLW